MPQGASSGPSRALARRNGAPAIARGTSDEAGCEHGTLFAQLPVQPGGFHAGHAPMTTDTLEGEEEVLASAHRLLAELARETADPPGVTRASFGEGEARAHAMLRREAGRLELESRTDAIGNLYLTLPGRDRTAPVMMIGSHMDSVRHGGNFDGAAGVIAGMALLEWLVARQLVPPADITLMVIRAEELVWFPTHYLGSRAAFGLLPRDSADTLERSDSGRTLAEHMADEGFDPDAIRHGRAQLDPAKIAFFLELHIEQGPVLRAQGVPAGIVTAIRGNVRYRFARITGETTHAGGVPREHRKDALSAGVRLVSRLERWWHALEQEGRDFVLTVGAFSTNPATHGITKVPGEISFTLDFRSTDRAARDAFDRRLVKKAQKIARQRGVEIDLGPATRADEAMMDERLRERLYKAARKTRTPVIDITSGGGHDCAVFAWQGIPSAMIFIANDKGSHNPEEHMERRDFDAAWRILAAFTRDWIGHG